MSDNIKHHFGKDIYIREGILKQGQRIIKHTHTYDHFSILGVGSVVVLSNGVMKQYFSGDCIKIEANVEHEVLAVVDSKWFCIHGTTEEINDLEGVHIE